MKIMLTGANGQVGWELQRSLLPLGEVVALTRADCDLSKPETIPELVQALKPDVIVNAAAYTAVDRAEQEESLATTINADAVDIFARQAEASNTLLIHYSTDYVFDGTNNIPYTENDATNPINCYGRSKLLGEQAIQQSGCSHLILRTSWVYASRGNNFIKSILKLARERESFNVVSDQIGAPTSAELIADVTAHILCQLKNNKARQKTLNGIYNLTAKGWVSWYEYAQLITDYALHAGITIQARPENINPITTSEFPTPAKRPLYSRLNTNLIESDFEIFLPDWKVYIYRALDELSRQIIGNAQ